MNSDTLALVTMATLWGLFFLGIYIVRRDKRKDNSPKWAEDHAGRR